MRAKSARAMPRDGLEAAALGNRIRERIDQVEEEVRARVLAVADGGESADPTYSHSLRLAIVVGIEYWIEGLQGDPQRPPEVPAQLLDQARLAARRGVGLEVVLRRYFAGYAALGDFLLEEAIDRDPREGIALRQVLRSQASLLDRLYSEVSEAYMSEAGDPPSHEERRTELVECLLAGKPVDGAALDYDFNAAHVGLLASGPQASEAIRQLARELDCRLLLIRPDRETSWAWLGRRLDHVDAAAISRAASTWPPGYALAIGERGEGIGGWRRTHRQAAAALPLARPASNPVVRYGEVAMLASVLQDDLLATSLRQLFIDPLEFGCRDGELARRTLRAYLEADRNVSSAAASLGIKRHTVTSRLREVESAIGRPLNECAAELELALDLSELLQDTRNSAAS